MDVDRPRDICQVQCAASGRDEVRNTDKAQQPLLPEGASVIGECDAVVPGDKSRADGEKLRIRGWELWNRCTSSASPPFGGTSSLNDLASWPGNKKAAWNRKARMRSDDCRVCPH